MLTMRIDTASELEAVFRMMGRGGQFSSAGYEALIDYYNEYEHDMEIDVISICCTWTEYADAKELVEAYGDDIDCYILSEGIADEESEITDATRKEHESDWLEDEMANIERSHFVLETIWDGYLICE